MNGHPFTVIGVGPPAFAGTGFDQPPHFFVPVMMHAVISPGSDYLRNRRGRVFTLLGKIPGVHQVALAALVPMDGSNRSNELVIRDGASPTSISPDNNSVSAGYFALMGISVLNAGVGVNT